MTEYPLVWNQSSCHFSEKVLGLYCNMEGVLLCFFRFILQHGGRALPADEMGLGKTLKAIALASCIHDSWPVLIMTPSSLRLQWASNLLMASDFKVMIADESHLLKNAQAKRTTAFVPVIKKSQYAILLSGTPALSWPIKLFKQLEALYLEVFRKCGNRYCKCGVFGIYQGAINHEELHNLMIATLMIRRLKKDVLSELPTKHGQQAVKQKSSKLTRNR